MDSWLCWMFKFCRFLKVRISDFIFRYKYLERSILIAHRTKSMLNISFDWVKNLDLDNCFSIFFQICISLYKKPAILLQTRNKTISIKNYGSWTLLIKNSKIGFMIRIGVQQHNLTVILVSLWIINTKSIWLLGGCGWTPQNSKGSLKMSFH